MASRGCYYGDYLGAPYYRYGTPPHYGLYGYYPRRRVAAPSAVSCHVVLFLAIACLLGVASLYSRFVSAMEMLLDQLRIFAFLLPLLLLLAVPCCCWAAAARGRWYRRAGGSLTLSLLVAPLVAAEPATRWPYLCGRRRHY